MGSFVFKWNHPASEVYVTGTFDNWSKSEKLEKVGDIFEKEVTLGDAHTAKKIYYKFVVDGNWTTDHTAPQENDESGNLNNFLTPDRIIKNSTPATAAIMSGVTPQSTTAELAKSAPLEQTGSADLPGSFPETPGLETGNFSVNPIPASEGVGNPIKLAAGEKVPEPSTITNNTINSTVKLDKESYENGTGAPVLPPVVTPQNERDQNGTGVLDLPPISSALIPESSLPMGTSGLGTYDAMPTIQSAAPMSSTAQLAAAVPLESSKVPEAVVESQKEAGVSPEASAIPEEVKEKSAFEKELLNEVPKAPTTSEGTAGKGTDKSEKGVSAGEAAAAIGGAAVAIGGAVTAAAYAAKDKYLPESVQKSIDSMNGTSNATTAADGTPEVVKESIAESGQSAEAAAYAEPLAEKSAVEKELLSEVKREPAVPETPATAAQVAPEVVKESIAESGQGAEAAAYSAPIAEKSAVEKELLSEVKPEQSTGEPAPKIIEPAPETRTNAAPETTETVSSTGLNASAATPVAGKFTSSDSRDVSPSTVPGTHTQDNPVVTTGVGSSTTPSTSTPAKDVGGSAATPTKSNGSKDTSDTGTADKKKKRRSFFGNLKEKFTHKKNT